MSFGNNDGRNGSEMFRFGRSEFRLRRLWLPNRYRQSRNRLKPALQTVFIPIEAGSLFQVASNQSIAPTKSATIMNRLAYTNASCIRARLAAFA